MNQENSKKIDSIVGKILKFYLIIFLIPFIPFVCILYGGFRQIGNAILGKKY